MATIESCKAWLLAHLPAAYKTEVPEKEQEILAHALLLEENVEEHIHLNFGNHALVLSQECSHADEEILKHYAGAHVGMPVYQVYVADAAYGKCECKLRLTRCVFADDAEKEEMIEMPENVCEALYKDALAHDPVAYKLFQNGAKSTICFAWRNVQRVGFMAMVAAMLRRYKLKIHGMRMSYINPMSTKAVIIGRIEVEGAADMDCFRREFEMIKGARCDVLDTLVESGVICGPSAMLLRAFTSIIGQILGDVDVAMFTEANIMEAFATQVSLTVDLLKMFEAKHSPKAFNMETYKKLAAEFEAKLKTLDTGMKRNDDRRRAIFYQAANVVKHIIRCNYYEVEKTGISFRMNPEYMNNVPGFDRKSKYPDLPFGIFYIKGRNFFGFQVRFRDLARGGMRTIITWDPEHESNERPNPFGECYNLAFTQQKKNKDIPEGGSKAICFLSANQELAKEEELVAKALKAKGMKPEEVAAKVAEFKKDHSFEYMYYNQRCFCQMFLKNFIWDHAKNCLMYGPNTVDHMKAPEYIYLGPDENFHDPLIDWVATESKRLQYYPVGGAFISGKDKIGVSHKEFGVTSWGCFQFMLECIKYKGLEGKKFTCKITGGPDGDVAGNTMLLLRKYLKEYAVVLEVTDGSGAAYDPEGFSLDQLEHMFHKVQMMQDYPAELLHEGGWIVCARKTRQATPLTKEALRIKKENGKVVEEWISFSEANKIWSTAAQTIKADFFLPSGGRPRALNMTNIETALDASGKPTFEVVVEGANLYITPDAREFLEDKGVIIMRDSSANKCGVISSSYEILGGLSMADEDFIKVKPELAKNILDRLEQVALSEARCMIKYWVDHDKKIRMTKISEMVSAQINKFTDQMAAYLKNVDLRAPENKALLDIFVNYLPACIRNNHLARAMERVPDMHKKAVISTKIACDMVYGKGLDWEPTIVDVLPLILKH